MGMLAVGMVGHLDCYDIPCVQLVQWIPESAQERMCTGFQKGPVGQIEFMMLACLMVKCHEGQVQFSLQRKGLPALFPRSSADSRRRLCSTRVIQGTKPYRILTWIRWFTALLTVPGAGRSISGLLLSGEATMSPDCSDGRTCHVRKQTPTSGTVSTD